MHLHRIEADPNAGSREAAEAAQRATNTQRAADVRKQLAKTATQLDDDASFESLILLGDAHTGEHSHQHASGEKPFEEPEEAVDKEAEPHRSYWA